MAISLYPNASTTVDTTARTFTTPTANALYQTATVFTPFIYRITCASSSTARFQFMDSNGAIIVSGNTTSGTVDVNLASEASSLRFWSDTANLIVNVQIVGRSVSSSSFTGTLDTITTSTVNYNYGTSTKAYVVVVGGGGCGRHGNPGLGGGSGGINSGLVNLAGTIAVTIGAGAAANSDANGGTTTFGSTPIVQATGGLSGLNGGTGGTPNGQNGNSGIPVVSPLSFVINGSTGSGGGFNAMGQTGSGIGTSGGGGGSWNSATGYGAGGGSWDQSGYRGLGTQGVVYVFRF
jgi:hypothetical protein